MGASTKISGRITKMFRDSLGIGEKGGSPTAGDFGKQAVLEVEGYEKFYIEDLATIGRDASSHVMLSNRSVSRHHARIFYEGGHYWVKDLNSANGTKVGDKKIKLQMLSGNDMITFGEVKATFIVSRAIVGPALVARDPLEEAEPTFESGTPTGGLVGRHETQEIRIQQLEKELSGARKEIKSKQKEIERLLQKTETLQNENSQLGAAFRQPKGVKPEPSKTLPSQNASVDPAADNERLRKLVKQLERALADSNIRLRDLQEAMDRKNR